MGSGRPNERLWVSCIVLVLAALAFSLTYCVLQLASSSSSGGGGFTFTNDFTSTSGTTKKVKDNANIMIIVLDDAGWGDFSYHSSDPWYALSTPNIDTILDEGLYFSNFHTQALCTPARASMMTGRWTYVLGLQRGTIFERCTDARLSWTYPTFAELLKERDYTNYFYGKWHLGMDSWRSTPRGRGFDFFLGGLVDAGGGEFVDGQGKWWSLNATWDCDDSMADLMKYSQTFTECLMESWDYKYAKWNITTGICYAYSITTVPDACTLWSANYPNHLQTNLFISGEYVHLALDQLVVDWWRDNFPETPPSTMHSDLVLKDEAIATLESLAPQDDWSMVLAFKTPHQDSAYLPHGTNSPVIEECARFFDQESVYYSYDRGAICQQMSIVDSIIGDIMQTLKSNGLWDSTLVIFTNDNGGTTGQGYNLLDEAWDYNFGINWPYRGVKGSYFEGGVKTVFSITGGALPSNLFGTVNDNLHHMVDVTPTILAAAGWSNEELKFISNGTNFDGFPLFDTSKASYGKHQHLILSVPAHSTGEWDDNTTAILLENGLKYASPDVWEDKYGYWGVLPEWKSIGTEGSCKDNGCVWNLTADPFEIQDIRKTIDISQFLDLVDKAHRSPAWTDGITYDWADCNNCSWGRTTCTVDTTISHEGYNYYAPWKDYSSLLY